MARIAALRGSSAAHQALLAVFAETVRDAGYRVAGLVQIAKPCSSGCEGLALQDLSTGDVLPISQDLGPGSTACKLELGGTGRCLRSRGAGDCRRCGSHDPEQVR